MCTWPVHSNIPYNKTNDKSIQCVNHLKAQDNNTVSLWQEIQLYWPEVPVDSKWAARDKRINYQTILAYNQLEDPTPIEHLVLFILQIEAIYK